MNVNILFYSFIVGSNIATFSCLQKFDLGIPLSVTYIIFAELLKIVHDMMSIHT